MNEWLNVIFRWTHLAAGVMWIGHLWFFNFVNAQLAKTYDPDSRKKVLPELMPRALYWFRWGAAYTWLTGILLLGVVYYMGGQLVPQYDAKMSVGLGTGVAVGATSDNLNSAITGETYEYTEMYPGFAKVARGEGFEEIAEWFETLARAEKSHAGRFQKGLESLDH